MTTNNPASGNDLGLTGEDKQLDITDLPFVRGATKAEMKAGRKFPRVFWSVTPSGDHEADCKLGDEYARQALDYITDAKTPYVLAWVVEDMIALGNKSSGVELGFMSHVARRAMVGVVMDRLIAKDKAKAERNVSIPIIGTAR